MIAWPVNGVVPGPSIVWLPVVIALHTLFNLGLAAWTARLTVPFRDINNLIPHLNRLWLYLSPIIWPLSLIEARGGWAEQLAPLNPMFGLLSFYRMALMGRELDLGAFLVALVWTMLIGVGGIVSLSGMRATW